MTNPIIGLVVAAAPGVHLAYMLRRPQKNSELQMRSLPAWVLP